MGERAECVMLTRSHPAPDGASSAQEALAAGEPAWFGLRSQWPL